MIVTALLVKWSQGWAEVVNPSAITQWGRREALLGLGACQSIEEVNGVGNQQLIYFGDPRTEIGVDLVPTGPADLPYVAFRVGDTITLPDVPSRVPASERVQAITVTMDDDGVITYAPELRDIQLDDREKFAEAIEKMANGTLDGESKVGQPLWPLIPQPNRAPPAPTGGGLTIVSTRPPTGYDSSDRLFTPPGLGEDYTLTKFQVTPSAYGPFEGEYPRFQFWQEVPGGDGSSEVARVEPGLNYQPGLVYVGTVFDSSIIIGSGFGVGFRSQGTIAGDMLCEAIFDSPGGTVTLTWQSDTLFVQRELQR